MLNEKHLNKFTGHFFSEGEPSKSTIKPITSKSESPRNKTLWISISAKIQPADLKEKIKKNKTTRKLYTYILYTFFFKQSVRLKHLSIGIY